MHKLNHKLKGRNVRDCREMRGSRCANLNLFLARFFIGRFADSTHPTTAHQTPDHHSRPLSVVKKRPRKADNQRTQKTTTPQESSGISTFPRGRASAQKKWGGAGNEAIALRQGYGAARRCVSRQRRTLRLRVPATTANAVVKKRPRKAENIWKLCRADFAVSQLENRVLRGANFPPQMNVSRASARGNDQFCRYPTGRRCYNSGGLLPVRYHVASPLACLLDAFPTVLVRGNPIQLIEEINDPMPTRNTLGGVIHTYQRYDAQRFPSPTQPPADMVSPALEHLLAYGDLRELSDEELARAVKLDPSQIAGLGPTLESLRAMLEERKRKILQTYETESVQKSAKQAYRQFGEQVKPPKPLRDRFQRAFHDEQIRELERVWYTHGKDTSEFAQQLVKLVDRLGDKYEIDELAAKYDFTGRQSLTVPEAIEVKQELETIDRLLKQLEEAAKNAQIGVIDLEELSQYAEPGDMDQLARMQQQVEELLRHMAEQQGLERGKRGYEMTPKAMRLFQGKLLEQIFSHLLPSRTGRHTGPIVGEGAVELQATKPYEFGDSVANMDITATLVNAMLRDGAQLPLRLKADDIVIHRTRNNPKCATAVLMDMSGSMRYDGQYINVKRMGLALDGLIRREYPGDFLQFIEMYTVAKPRLPGEVAQLLPKPVTIFDPYVRLWADMADPEMSEVQLPPHFTNIQHALQLGRQYLGQHDTPNRQIILITDGLPTAHFEGQKLFLLYPPDKRTEEATLREGLLCRREGITINIFLLQSWSQSREDIQFAYKLAESTTGRVFFTAGKELDRFVVWDYVNRRRSIIA